MLTSIIKKLYSIAQNYTLAAPFFNSTTIAHHLIFAIELFKQHGKCLRRIDVFLFSVDHPCHGPLGIKIFVEFHRLQNIIFNIVGKPVAVPRKIAQRMIQMRNVALIRQF